MNIYALVPFISFIAYGVLIGIARRPPRRRARQLFALFLFPAMMWSFSSFMLHANYFPEQTLWWNRSVVVFLLWMTVAYYHFVRAFVNKPGGAGVHLGYGLLVILVALLAQGYILKGSYVVDGVLYHELGVWLYAMGAILISFAGAAAFFLLQRYRGSSDPLDRNRTAYLLISLAIVVPFVASNLIPTLAKYPIDHIGNLGNALIISYAILRYQLLDIKLVMRRGLAYSLSTIFFTSLYLLLLFTIQRFFHTLTGYSTVAAAAGFALLIAALFHPLRNLSQQYVDRLFYRETYDYRQMLLSFSDRMSNVLDLEELAENMLYPLTKALHASQASLLLPSPEGGDFSVRFTRPQGGGEGVAKARFSGDNPVVRWLAREGKAFSQDHMDTIPELKGLWKVEIDALNAFELLCPIRRKGNLVGILALGKKVSESPYSGDDIDLLMTIATEAAFAIENAEMLDNLKKQQLRVEQLLAETVQAQEEERKRISVELHDSVAQWLVGASYRIQTCDRLLTGDGNRKIRAELQAIESTIGQSLTELRRVLSGLRPLALDELGLTYALKRSLEELKANGIIYHFETLRNPMRFSSSVEIATYRIVQEALSNVRKHADATVVNLRLRFEADNLTVEVRDNGKGFNLSQTLESAISVGHLGLLGMKQRAESLGGSLTVNASAGAGTTVVLMLPIQNTDNEERMNGNHQSAPGR